MRPFGDFSPEKQKKEEKNSPHLFVVVFDFYKFTLWIQFIYMYISLSLLA
jgi:hypothetical protein